MKFEACVGGSRDSVSIGISGRWWCIHIGEMGDLKEVFGLFVHRLDLSKV